ncbi:MAG: PIN domain-containing protein [Spirochaetes bacterium]|nr:PIN domain-containing protein [Spirochaetota bacterium]
MERIFIDTGAFVARFLTKDNLHSKAVKTWAKIQKAPVFCVTSSAVLSETATLLARRANPIFAAEKIRTIYTSPRFLILRSTEDTELQALKLMTKYADLPLSYVDALTVILMRSQALKTIFSYDADFRVLKFSLY